MSAALRQLLWYLLAGTRGGPNRTRILEALHERPHNAHELSEALGLHYRTIQHHLDLLRKNGLVSRPMGDAYASPYFLSPILEENYALFLDIRGRSTQKRGR